MSFKERLFGTPWEHKDDAVRARAVGESDDDRLIPELPGLAHDDPSPDVRLAALKRLDDESRWLEAARSDADARVRERAAAAVLRRILVTPAGEHLQARLEWLAGRDDADTLRQVARRAADPTLRRAAVERITAQGFLGDCYLDEPDEELAAIILQRITQASTLERIAGEARKRRKSRHDQVMDRLAALGAETGEDIGTSERAERLVRAMESLARGAHIGERRKRLAGLESAWAQLPRVPESLATRFAGAGRIVRAALEPRREPAANPAEPQPESPAEPAAGPDPELTRLAESMRTLAASPAGKNTGERLGELVSAWDRRWNQMAEATGPGEADGPLKDEFMALAAEVRARLKAAGPDAGKDAKPADTGRQDPETGDPPAEHPGGDPSTSDPSGIDLETLLAAADQALESGDIAESHAAVRQARSAFDRLPSGKRPRGVSGRLQRMAGRLKEMRDWQHWSNNKLRERLIQRVEEIDAESLHPDAITARLKEIRERWQELDRQEVLPGDRHRFAAPPAQWRRFQAACKQAFETAKPYFEKRSKVQEDSLHDLEAFLDDAGKVVADDDADADTQVRYLRAARQAIRNLDALPPKRRGAMAARLRELMDGLSSRLDAIHERIETEKRKLIAEARKLGHESDRKAAIDRAKALQAEWKRIGPTRRKRENQLWKEFREPIDPLFESLDAERGERKQAEQQRRRELEAICQQAEELAALDDAEIEDAAGRLSGLEQDWQGRNPPPPLARRFEKACKQFRERIRALAEQREQAARSQLADRAEYLQALWQARDGDGPGSVPAPELAPSDDPVAVDLDARIARFADPDADADALAGEVAENTDAARQVAVEMEFLAGLESPESDRKRRMDYQIRRLSERLGEGAPRPDLESERTRLFRRRLETFPRDPGTHEALEKRFREADKIIKNMIAT